MNKFRSRIENIMSYYGGRIDDLFVAQRMETDINEAIDKQTEAGFPIKQGRLGDIVRCRITTSPSNTNLWWMAFYNSNNKVCDQYTFDKGNL